MTNCSMDVCENNATCVSKDDPSPGEVRTSFREKCVTDTLCVCAYGMLACKCSVFLRPSLSFVPLDNMKGQMTSPPPSVLS